MKNNETDSAFLNKSEEENFYNFFMSELKNNFGISYGGIFYKNSNEDSLVYEISFSKSLKLHKLKIPLKIEKSTIGCLLLKKDAPFSKEEKLKIREYSISLTEKIKDFEISKIYQNQLKILQSAIVQKNDNEKKLKEKNEELVKTDKIRTKFLSNVSHELRTPLNSIIGFSTALKNEMIGALNEKQKNYANKILISAIHLSGLINDILDITKLESGEMKVNLALHFPSLIIDEVINIIEPLAFDKNIKIKTDFKYQKQINIDYLKFKQIIYNLLGNAIKFSHPNSKIIISTSNKNDKTYIKIKDFGIGIDKKDQKRIFEKFVQLDNIYMKDYSSTGLGLTITSELVKIQNGKIKVKSELNKGSEFILEF